MPLLLGQRPRFAVAQVVAGPTEEGLQSPDLHRAARETICLLGQLRQPYLWTYRGFGHISLASLLTDLYLVHVQKLPRVFYHHLPDGVF